MSSARVSVGRTALLALVYVLAGELGLLFALPPGYATIIWPPSGIAMGALAVFGARLWPGVWLGSFLLNAHVAGAFADWSGFLAPKLVTAACIGVGSTLQSLA